MIEPPAAHAPATRTRTGAGEGKQLFERFADPRVRLVEAAADAPQLVVVP